MRWSRFALAGSASIVLLVAAMPFALAQQALPELVVTATARPEPISQIAGTVQVIKREQIETSTGKSVTDLLAENAVGFLSEWSPGQTSLNIVVLRLKVRAAISKARCWCSSTGIVQAQPIFQTFTRRR